VGLITIREFPGSLLSSLRTLLGLVLLGAAYAGAMPKASPNEDEIAMIASRGPAAQARVELDRVHALADAGKADEAVTAADAFLASLQPRDSADPDELLDADTLDALAHEAIACRTAALLSQRPLPKGYRGEFLGSVIEGATYLDWKTGVPASVTLAQAILESNWGKAAPGNNLFGLKGKGPAGSTRHPVVEYSHGRRHVRFDFFRAYATLEESLVDHAKIITTGRVYARARAASEDPAAFARALQGTYASDPHYAQKVTRLIASEALDRFDFVGRRPVP
jgi:flagellum-specific peptidoglycan hydrolase FlgJ